MRRIETVGIIGGGLSGLAAGVWLARRGFRVRLFEANGKAGGCCATTRLRGFTFNDGALYVALPRLLDSAFAALGLDRPSAVPLRRIDATQTTRLTDGTIVTLGGARGVQVHGVDGEARSARLAQDIERLMEKWRPVLRLFADELLPHPFSPARLIRRGWRHLPKLRGSLARELERQFADPAARATMAGLLLYTGVPAREAPVVQILGLVALFDEGFHLPEGGMGAIPDALAAAFAKQGGEIVTGAKVRRIGVADGRVTSLEIEGHGSIPVDAVISTVSGMHTFGSLLDARDVPASLARKARKAPLSQRALCVQLGLANTLDVASHSMSVLPPMEEQDKLLAPGADSGFVSYTVPTVTMPELAPTGGSIVEMFPPIDPAWPLERWTDEARDAVAESAIASLARIHALDIVARRVMGPRDYAQGMHLYGGAVYGLSTTAGPGAQFPHRTPIEGLFQAGQTTYPGFGVAPATWSGVLAANALAESARGA